MNRVHRKIWSARLGAFVAVAETAKGRGKVAGSATVGAVAMAIGGMAGAHAAGLAPGALPTGGQVSAGSAAISSSGNTLNVIQGSQRAAINWQSFNIGNPRSTVTIYQLARLVARLANSDSPIRFVRWDFPDVELRIPDVKKAEKLLGFRAHIDLEDGIARTIDWYRARRDA